MDNFFIINSEYIKNNISKTNVSSSLFEILKLAINDGLLPTNYTMPNENVVSQTLGIGRSTLREAYINLELQGYITRSKAGTCINPVKKESISNLFDFSIKTDEEFQDIMSFRYMLDGEIAVFATKRATQKDKIELTQIHELLTKNKDNPTAFLMYDDKFHLKLGEASHNKMLYYTMQSTHTIVINEVFNPLPEFLTQLPIHYDNIIYSHEKILKSIIDGNPTIAAQAMHDHISRANFLLKSKL